MLATACDPPAAPPAPFRLVEQQAGSPIPTRKLDGTVLRVLDPGEPVQELALPSPPVASTLQVQMGVDPAAGDTRVLFEATLHAPGSPDTPLLRREITPGGWNAQRVPVPVAAAGASLRFRRTVLSGDPRALSLSAWGNPVLATAGAERPRDVPDIILISFDTLRADRLGCYGSTAGATPAFDAFAAEGVVYERAYSPSTWTLPSHRAMLSGRFPLAPEEPGEAPLPELLRRHGYRTAGFSGGGFMSEVFGFDAGFDSYYSYPGGTGGAKCPDDRFDGREVFDRARAWLEDHREEPAFLFLHTYDVHDTCPFQADPAAPSMHRKDPGPEARARELAYYNGLVVRLDGLFARFLEDLRQLGKAENTLVVVTADHGEAFWEHGFDGHGKGRKPYDELARVPLVLRWPSRLPAAVRVPQPVSNTAITATILGLVGAGVPDDLDARELPGVGLQEPGVDLLAAKVFEATQAGMLPDTGPPATWFLDPVYVHENNLLGVRTARHKLVTSRIDPNQTRVYDLATDPRETRNLAGRDPDLDAKLDALAARYWEKLAAAPSGSTKPVDDATRERLKALGYAE